MRLNAAKVKKEVENAYRMGISGVPAFIINRSVALIPIYAKMHG